MTLARIEQPDVPQGGTLVRYEKPKEVVKRAQEMADALMDVVKKKGLVKRIGNSDYLEAEGWQLLARFDRATPVTEWVRYVKEAGYEGYEARVKIIQDGAQIGAAEAFCGLDEFVTQGQKGGGKVNAAKSMAQTRAMAKALRLCYSFVVVLAGYQGTPAEEMTPSTPQGGHSNHDVAEMGFCPVHDLAFVHRKGVSQKTKQPYDFWACPDRDCKERPPEQAPPKPAQAAPKATEPIQNGRGTDLQNRMLIAKREAGWSNASLAAWTQAQYEKERWVDLTDEQKRELVQVLETDAEKVKAEKQAEATQPSENADWNAMGEPEAEEAAA